MNPRYQQFDDAPREDVPVRVGVAPCEGEAPSGGEAPWEGEAPAEPGQPQRCGSSMTRRSTRSRRRAFSVIELLITIGVSAAAIGITALALARVHHVDRMARASNDLDRTIARLAFRLRQDCNAASSANVTNDVAMMKVGNETITYKKEAKGLVRHGVLGRKKTFDTFRIPKTVQYSWVVKQRNGKQVLVLSLRPSVASSSSSLSLQAHSVQAVIGSDIAGLTMTEVTR